MAAAAKSAENLSKSVIQDEITDTPVIKNGKGFMFDIIVVRLDISNKPVTESSKLKVEVKFNNTDLTVTSSRINVLDFKDGRSHEFIANPLVLKDELAKNPLRFQIRDNGNVLGTCSLEWPQQFLFGLIDCAGQMTHSDETDIKDSDGIIIGTIQVFVRLQPKCEEYEEDNTIEGKCRNANKEIRPNDIMFVVGEDKNPCCCSQVGIIPASDSKHALDPKCLDLSNFRPVNCQTIQSSTNILDSLDPACKGLKTATNHYQNLIDSVMGKKKTMTKYKIPAYDLESKHSEKYSAHTSSFDKKSSFYSSESLTGIPSRCHSYNRGDFANDLLIQVAQKEDMPNLVENVPKVSRNCPLCEQDMSFLPKLAACPNCCYKPVPYFEEKPYNDNQTADQLLEQRNDSNQECDSITKDQPTPGSRCTCKNSKTCAYCRIRTLCGDIFQPSTKRPEKRPEPKASEIQCASSVDSRPFLTKVFSEFKDLFDLKTETEQNKRVAKVAIKKPQQNSAAPSKTVIEIDHPNSEKQHVSEIKKRKKCCHAKKRCAKPASTKIVKSRLYDYEPVRSSSPAHIGHKTCINGYAGRKNVPSNMGWLWNAPIPGINAKWKPGAICKPIKELMSYFLKDYPADTLLVSRYSYRKKHNTENNQSPILIQKPTLHISKKNGEYVITMRPLKDAESLKKAADPYENMKPIQFRITKNPQLVEMRDLKQRLKANGFKKCTCHKPIIYCYCRTFLEKKKLEFECNKECHKRNMPPCSDTLVLSDTSDSEGEFDFSVTPPVGVIKPERLIKPDLVNEGTQYVESDWNTTPLFPKPPNKYMAMYQCAVTERKASKKGARGGGAGGGGGSKGNEKCVGGGKGGAGGSAGTAIDFTGKYGGRGVGAQGVVGPVVSGRGKGKSEDKPPPFDMMKYLKQANRRYKLTPAEAAAKRKEKMRLLRGVSPPLLCTIDRRRKPCDPCVPVFPCGDNRIC